MADITFDSSDVLQVISTDIEKFEYIGRSSTRGWSRQARSIY